MLILLYFFTGKLFLVSTAFILLGASWAFPHRLIKLCMQISVLLSAIVTVVILLSLFNGSYKFFQLVNIVDFMFGTEWKPYNTINEDYEIVMLFGILPLLVGTFLVTTIAIFFSAPIGLFSAIYLSKYAKTKTRNVIKPIIELLAGIPTVVYGYFAMNMVAPFICDIATYAGLSASAENALAAGIVIGIMIIPLITSLVDDILQTVPKSLYYGSLALGSTRAEAILKVILPSAKAGIFSAILLAITRALGETMIVLMATGIKSDLSFNPLNSITTVTVQIATILKSDHDFNSPVTLSAYALALTLFIVTWILNAIAFNVVKKYRVGY